MHMRHLIRCQLSPQTGAASSKLQPSVRELSSDALASMSRTEFHCLYCHGAAAAYSCTVVFAARVYRSGCHPLRGTQTQGTDERGPRNTRAGAGIVERDSSGTGDDIFNEPPLKCGVELT